MCWPGIYFGVSHFHIHCRGSFFLYFCLNSRIDSWLSGRRPSRCWTRPSPIGTSGGTVLGWFWLVLGSGRCRPRRDGRRGRWIEFFHFVAAHGLGRFQCVGPAGGRRCRYVARIGHRLRIALEKLVGRRSGWRGEPEASADQTEIPPPQHPQLPAPHQRRRAASIAGKKSKNCVGRPVISLTFHFIIIIIKLRPATNFVAVQVFFHQCVFHLVLDVLFFGSGLRSFPSIP